MTVKEVTPEIKKSVEAYINCASSLDELYSLCDTTSKYKSSCDCRSLAKEVRSKIIKVSCAVSDMSDFIFGFFGITEKYLENEKNMEHVTDILCSDKSIDDICKDLFELGKRGIS